MVRVMDWTGLLSVTVAGAMATIVHRLYKTQKHQSQEIKWPIAIAIIGGFVLIVAGLCITASQMN